MKRVIGVLIIFIMVLLIYTYYSINQSKLNTETYTIASIDWSFTGIDRDNSALNTYTYTIVIKGDEEDIENIAEVKLNYGSAFKEKVESEAAITISQKGDTIELTGQTTINTYSLSKRDIIDLKPYIESLDITLKHKDKVTIRLDS